MEGGVDRRRRGGGGQGRRARAEGSREDGERREEEEGDTWVPHVSGCGGERTEAAVEIWRVEIESLLEEIS